MTHTLHRRGDKDSFRDDYIIFAMTANGFNRPGCIPALRRFEEIVTRYSIANMGDMKTGGYYLAGREKILNNIAETSIVHAVLRSKEDLAKAIKEVKEADLGLSVIISGILEDVDEACKENQITRHTVEVSLGIMGNESLLPENELLQITTMCGHGMVPQTLARQMLIDIKKGKRTAEEAAQFLSTPCVCGVFNPCRAQSILEELVDVWCIDED